MPNNLGKRFTKMLDETVTKAEVSKLFKMLTDFVKEAKTRLETMHSSHMQEMAAKAETLVKRVETAEKQLSEGLTKGGKEQKDLIYSESRTLIRLMEQKIADFAAQIPEEYEDDEIRAELENIRKSIPEVPPQFDPSTILAELTNLIQKVEKLEKDIEELKKRPIGGGTIGGGVTNMRIAQAFKYILKTEAVQGTIDGANTTFTLSQPIAAILSLSINGETIAQIPNYTIAGRTFTFSTALPAVYNGKDFEVKYIAL